MPFWELAPNDQPIDRPTNQPTDGYDDSVPLQVTLEKIQPRQLYSQRGALNEYYS